MIAGADTYDMLGGMSPLELFQPLTDALAAAEATQIDGTKWRVSEAIAVAVRRAQFVKSIQGRVFFIGNGASASIASHMSADWLKNGGFAAMCFSDPALLTCVSNDCGYDNSFALPLSRHGSTADLLFAISSSGQSANILEAVSVARKLSMMVVTLSGFMPDNPLRKLGNINFWVPSEKYGNVETAHLAICHAILDQIIE